MTLPAMVFVLLGCARACGVRAQVPLDQPGPGEAVQLHDAHAAEAYTRNRAELRRLQCLDAVTNKDYLLARADAAQSAGALAEIKAAIEQVKAGGMDVHAGALRRGIQERQKLVTQALVDFELTIDGCRKLCDTASRAPAAQAVFHARPIGACARLWLAPCLLVSLSPFLSFPFPLRLFGSPSSTHHP